MEKGLAADRPGRSMAHLPRAADIRKGPSFRYRRRRGRDMKRPRLPREKRGRLEVGVLDVQDRFYNPPASRGEQHLHTGERRSTASSRVDPRSIELGPEAVERAVRQCRPGRYDLHRHPGETFSTPVLQSAQARAYVPMATATRHATLPGNGGVVPSGSRLRQMTPTSWPVRVVPLKASLVLTRALADAGVDLLRLLFSGHAPNEPIGHLLQRQRLGCGSMKLVNSRVTGPAQRDEIPILLMTEPFVRHVVQVDSAGLATGSTRDDAELLDESNPTGSPCPGHDVLGVHGRMTHRLHLHRQCTKILESRPASRDMEMTERPSNPGAT